MEQPRIADGAAADHQSLGAGQSQYFVRVLRRVNVAVGQHWKRQFTNRPRDAIVMHFAAVHFGDRPAVHRQQINRMFRENREQLLEHLR